MALILVLRRRAEHGRGEPISPSNCDYLCNHCIEIQSRAVEVTASRDMYCCICSLPVLAMLLIGGCEH